jgi:hypothetical protein
MSAFEDGEVRSSRSSVSHEDISLSPPSLDGESLASADDFPLSKGVKDDMHESDEDQLNIQPPQVSVIHKKKKKTTHRDSRKHYERDDKRSGGSSKAKSSRR